MTVWSLQRECKFEGGHPRKVRATEETYTLKISSLQKPLAIPLTHVREIPWSPVESNS